MIPAEVLANTVDMAEDEGLVPKSVALRGEHHHIVVVNWAHHQRYLSIRIPATGSLESA